jgi:hypothetical protein
MVPIRAFFVDRFEVTRADYGRFLAANPAHRIPADERWEHRRQPTTLDGDLPVTNVTLFDAQAFAAWRGKRLPTSHEWEWAARGPEGFRFPWGDVAALVGVANTRRARFFGRPPHLTPVGLFESGKSPVGAYDMVGNVEEWTCTKIEGLISDSYFVRGGSYLDDILVAGTRGGTTILDTHRPADSGTEHWEPIPDRLAGPTSWGSNRGFRCVVEEATVQRLRHIHALVEDLGARDAVTWIRRTRPAERALLEIGGDALPALRHAAARLPPGMVSDRLQQMIRRLEEDGTPASEVGG